MKLSQRHLDSLDLKHTDNLSENGESITVARQKVEAVKCLICEKPYKSKKSLYDHNKRIHLGFKKLSLKLEEKVSCTICGLSLKKGSISNHYKSIHLGQRQKKNVNKHQCFLCGKVYLDTRDLKTHVNVVHLDIKNKFYCEVCGNVLSCSSNLKRHWKNTHTNEKN